jgi:adhesin HecA-like repeat protein
LVTTNNNLLSSGSAKVILNEVTSGNASQLLGYTEIAGAKADLILANPNGISCAGCGFINTSRLLMVAGSSNFDSGGNLGFNLKEQANPNLYVPLITIEGLGLDISRTTSTDIVASAIKLLSSIYGSDDTALTIKAGKGRYDYTSKEIIGDNSKNNSEAVFAIDASNLAKIQSGQVFLIATKEGVGVNMAAEILASSEVVIEANGDIYYANISSGDSVNLKSTTTIKSVDADSSISSPDITIAANEFKNLGDISAYNFLVQNTAIITNLGSIESLAINLSNISNINNSGYIYGENSLDITGTNLSNDALGTIYSPQNYTIALTGLLTNSGVISSSKNLVLTANQLSNANEISAQGNLTLTITNTAVNSGNLITNKVLNLSANSFSNSGATQSDEESTFNLATLTNSESSSIYSAQDLTLNLSDSFTNSGEISSSNNLAITGTSTIDNSYKILASGTLNIAGSSFANNSDGIIASLSNSLTLILTGNLQNDGELNSATALTITSQDLTNNGNLISGDTLTITTAQLTNSGLVSATANINLFLESLTNSGEISTAENLTITSSQDILNSNIILSSGSLEITADNLTNEADSAIASLASYLTFTISNNLQNSGELNSATNLIINSSSLDNSGDILSSANLTISTTDLATNSGNLQSIADFSLTTASFDNSNIIKAFGTATFITDSIINQEDALILSTENMAITANNSFSNSGSILSASNLDLTSALTTNSNEIFSNGNLILTLSDTLNNSGLITSLGTLEINSSATITNSNEIISDGILTISATSLNNSDTIQSNSDIVLNLTSLDNSKNIIAGKDFDITASNTISNSGVLQSDADFTVNTTNFSNAAASLILAGNNLSITAASIVNKDTKPSDSVITSGIVSASGTVTLTADSVNNDSGIIAGKTTTLNALTASSVDLSSDLGLFIATSAITLNLGDIDYTITGTITADNVDITANNIVNHGNVTASDYIKLNATGLDGISGSGNITNGYTANDTLNADILLAAGSYVELTAKNNIENYGTISATTNTTLTASEGNINNYAVGKITGGSGTTLINALNGSFNNTSNTSLFTANNNAVFNVNNLNNSGEISTAYDFTANISNNFTNNASALIWTGRNTTFNLSSTQKSANSNAATAGIFKNYKADIYSGGNITIQRNDGTDTASNKINLFQNISGSIITLGYDLDGNTVDESENEFGNIIIKANIFENKRSIDPKTGLVTLPEEYIYSWGDTQYGTKWTNTNAVALIYVGNAGTNDNAWHDNYAATQGQNNLTSIAGSLNAANDFTIQTNNLLNYVSDISSVGNMTIQANIFNNNSFSYYQNFYYEKISLSGGGMQYKYGKFTNLKEMSSSIKSGKSFLGSGFSNLNNVTISPKYQEGSSTVGDKTPYNVEDTGDSEYVASGLTTLKAASDRSHSSTVNNIDIYTLATTGVITVDLSGISSAISDSLASTVESDLPDAPSDVSALDTSISEPSATASKSDIVFSGAFKINLSKSATTPLVEARSQFTDVSRFFGSIYYFNALGLDGAQLLRNIDQQSRINIPTRILGDSFVETSLILDQLKTLTNDSLLLSETTDEQNAQIKELLDNSVAELTRLGLDAEDVALNGLSTDQANSLTKDIVTFETTTVNGLRVLAPKIYLSRTTRDRLLGTDSISGTGSLAGNSSILGKDNLIIDSPLANLTNSGSIIAGNNVFLNVGTLTNLSHSLGSNVENTLSSLATIKSGADLTITANNIAANASGITLKNSILDSKGTLSLSALNNISISNDSALKIFSPTVADTISTFSTKDDAASARASLIFNAGSDIQISSLGSINIANNYFNTAGSIFMNAANDINNTNYTINASDNVVMTATNINNIHKDNGYSYAAGAKANETRIEAGNIVSLDASNDINNIGATIKAGSLVYLTAGNDINNKALVNYSINGTSAKLGNLGTITNLTEEDAMRSNADTIRSTLVSKGSIESDGNIVLVAGNDINNKGSNITAADNTYLEATNGNINVTTALLRDRTLTRWGHGKKGGVNITDNTSNIQSSITSGTSGAGTLELLATSDLTTGSDLSGNINITGSSLTSFDNLTLTAQNDINITSAQDKTYNFSAGRVGRGKSYLNQSSSTTQIGSNLTTNNNGDITISSGVGNTDIVGSDDAFGSIAIIASKLITKDVDGDGDNNVGSGNITIAAKEDLLIASGLNSSYSESSSSKKGSTVFKNSISIDQSLINVKSELTANGDISTSSGTDTNLIGVKLNANNATINAGRELNVYSVADQHYSFSSSTKTRNFSAIAQVVAPGLSLASSIFEAIPVPVIGNFYIYANSLANGDFSHKSNLLEKNKITNQSSDIIVSNNLTLTANNNINIAGSNLNGGGDASITSTAGDVNIYDVKDVDYVRSESHNSRTTWSSVIAGATQAFAAGISTFIAFNTISPKTINERKDTIKENQEASAEVPQKTETHIKVNSDETIIASNLNFAGDVTIDSNQNTNITSSNLTSSTGNVNITSGDSTSITTDTENDYSYSFDEKKTPSIAAALSNAVVKIFNDFIPSFGHSKSDNTQSNNEIKEMVYDQDKSKVESTSNINIASNITANNGNINIISGNNNLISGSDLNAGNDINLTSTNGTTIITSAQDKNSTSTETTTQDYNQLSANYNRGRVSANSQSDVLEQTSTTTTITQKSSNLNANNNINITSKGNLNILSSNITSGIDPNSSDTSLDGITTLTSLEGNVNILSLQNSTVTSSETRSGTLTLSAGIGNSHVDTAYAEYDAIQAAKEVATAKAQLNHMETLRKNGQADDDAVEDAKINLSIAILNLSLAELKLAAAATKSAASASSLWTGFYGDLRLSIAGTKTNSNSSLISNVASNINSAGNLLISSGMSLSDSNTDLINGLVGNTNITGSNITSSDGNINITSKNNTVIQASKDTYNNSTTSKAWESNITLASSAGSGIAATLDNAINALQISLGLNMSRNKSDTSSVTYNNSSLTALNGDIKINSLGTQNGDGGSQTGGDTTLKGANLLASNVTINTQGNLNVESLQNSYYQKDKSFGVSLGGGSGTVSAGVNYSSNKTDRLWVDNQTSIIGTNSVTINTANNTNVKGAVIANIINANSDSINGGNGLAGYNINSDTLQGAIDGGNLTINTNSLTFQNLEDHYYTKSFGIALSTTIGSGSNNTIGQGTAPATNTNQQNSFYPTGSTTLGLQNSSTKKEQRTYATIGQGNIITGTDLALTFDTDGNLTSQTGGTTNDETILSNLNRDVTQSQIITKDMITGALERPLQFIPLPIQ